MKIDSNIIEAIEAAASELGGQAELSRRCGLGNSVLTKYRKGRVRSVSEANWERIYSQIKRHLPDDVSYVPKTVLMAASGLAPGLRAHEGDFLRFARSSVHELSEAVPIVAGRAGPEPFRVPDDAMAPEFRTDDVIVVDWRAEPEEGDAVVANTAGAVVLRRYVRTTDGVVLHCTNPAYHGVFVGRPLWVGRVSHLLRHFRGFRSDSL